jgi:hypothetical protein
MEFRVKRWGFRKNISDYFSDSKELGQMIATGKLKYDDLRKIVFLYNNWYDPH